MKTLLLLALASTLSAAAEWPRFLGGEGRSSAPERPGKTRFSGGDIAWETALPAGGHSSPVVVGGAVYLTFFEAGELVLAAYSLGGGEKRWEHRWEVVPHGHHKFNGMASATPCADGERVYLSWTSGRTRRAAALEHSGEQAWEVEVGAYSETHGSGASPVLSGGVLVVPNDCADQGVVVGLDRATGEVRWTYERSSSKTSFSTPLNLGGGTVVVAGTPYCLTALDGATGEVRWQAEPRFSSRTVSSPVLAGRHVFVTGGSGSSGKESYAHPLGDGNEGYRVKNGLPYVPTGVSDGERLYLWGDGGVVHCVRAADGGTLWRERASGPVYASPLLLGDVLVGCSRRGEVVFLETGDTFKKLGEGSLGEPVFATPAFVGGVLLVRTETRLVAVDLRGG